MARILVVDDEEDLLYFFAKYFESIGHEVLKTQFGEEAVPLILDSMPDVTFIDVRLKGVMSGLDVIKEVRVKAPERKIILLTAYQDVQEEALKNGVLFCISKPTGLEELEGAIDRAMHWKEGGQG